MKKILFLSLCSMLLCTVDMFSVRPIWLAHALWEGSTAVANLPVPHDFDYSKNPDITSGDFYRIYTASDVVYKVEIYRVKWMQNGSPSSLLIIYPDGQTTEIRIQGTPSGSGAIHPVKLKKRDE